ncbi:hypothetical protein ACMFMG_006097 [Clarireedia jacksonii]
MSEHRSHERGMGGSGIGESLENSIVEDQEPLLIRKQESHGFTLQLVVGKTVEYPAAGLVVATDRKFRSDTMGLCTANVPQWQDEEVGFPSRRELRNKFSGRSFEDCHALCFTTNQDIEDEKVRLILINMTDSDIGDEGEDRRVQHFETFRRSIIACLEVANRAHCTSVALPVFGGPPMSLHLLDDEGNSIYRDLINSIWEYFLPPQAGADTGEAILQAARRRSDTKFVNIIVESNNMESMDVNNELRIWEVAERLALLVDVWDDIFADSGPRGPSGLDGRDERYGKDGRDGRDAREVGDEKQGSPAQQQSVERGNDEAVNNHSNRKSWRSKRSRPMPNTAAIKRFKGQKPVREPKSGLAPRGRGRGGSVRAGWGDKFAANAPENTGHTSSCTGTTVKGVKCKNKAFHGEERCRLHRET